MTNDTLLNGQLYWDDQDPNNTGWWLRYYDLDGTEQGCNVDAAKDDSTEELAEAVGRDLAELSLTGEIRVIRGTARARICVENGMIAGWRS